GSCAFPVGQASYPREGFTVGRAPRLGVGLVLQRSPTEKASVFLHEPQTAWLSSPAPRGLDSEPSEPRRKGTADETANRASPPRQAAAHPRDRRGRPADLRDGIVGETAVELRRRGAGIPG